MEQSMFIEWVEKYFPGLVIRVVTKLNDTKNPLTYWHRTMLSKDYSVSGKWQSVSVSNSLVAADVVAMDSPLPLKKRPSTSKANGDIPKMGMELWLNETQLTELDTLVATGAADALIVAKLFADTPRVIGGIYERLEAMFLQGLSSGVTLVDDDKNVGAGVRLDYGYLTANQFTSRLPWTESDSTPFTDLAAITAKASLDGNVITEWICDLATINGLLKSTEASVLVASYLRVFNGNIPTPSLTQINEASQDRYGYTFKVCDRSVRYQKDGVDYNFKPWEPGQVIGLTSENVGTLIYATLAEQNHPVEGVAYQVVDDMILVSKYRQNKPALSEYTSSQARVVPVIDNVDQIYQLDATQNTVGVSPTANAGGDQTSTTASHAITGASASADGVKTVASVKWTKVSGPAGGTITGSTTLTPTVNSLVTGAYVFRLTVTDSEGLQTSDDVTVTATVA